MKKKNNWYEFQGELRSLLTQNKPQGVKIEESIIIIFFKTSKRRFCRIFSETNFPTWR